MLLKLEFVELLKYRKEIVLIQAVGAISQYSDPEYIRIIQELRKRGLSPTGNKIIDKSRLERAKEKLELSENEKIKTTNYQDSETELAKLEEERIGATQLSELNKILLGL